MWFCWIKTIANVTNGYLGVHQISDGFKHGLEVILFGVSTNNNVECFIHIRTILLDRRLRCNYKNEWFQVESFTNRVCLILVCIQPHANRSLIGLELSHVILVLDQMPLIVQQSFDFAASNRGNAKLQLLMTIYAHRSLSRVYLLREGRIVRNEVRWLNRDQKAHVVFPKTVPLLLDVLPKLRE